jgi:hypothetical protein
MAFNYDVQVCLGSLPKIRNHNLKVQIMRAFAEGAERAGARTIVTEDRSFQNARLAVMIGWVGMNFSGPHIYYRRDLIEHQQRIGAKIMSIDGSCFKFSHSGDMWLRYSLDSVFWDEGEYANQCSNNTHWQDISKTLNLQLKPWRVNGDHILICLQRDSGWNAKGFDQNAWLTKTIKIIRKFTERPIRIRPHPANTIDWSGITKQFNNVSISKSDIIDLQQDLHNAWAGVFYNSSSSVAAVLEGVPVFVSEPGAVTWDVSDHSTKNINNPAMPDRQQWLWDLSQAHWNIEQSRNGDIYRHFESYLPPA